MFNVELLLLLAKSKLGSDFLKIFQTIRIFSSFFHDVLLQPYDQWDFQGPPIMGPPYGKLPILFPYHSHKNP